MIVVNIRVEPFDVYGGRAGHGYDGYFGNPFRAKSEADRDRVCDLHEKWFLARVERDPVYRRRCLALRGLRVGCFCAPKRCHLDTVARWVNSQPEKDSNASS